MAGGLREALDFFGSPELGDFQDMSCKALYMACTKACDMAGLTDTKENQRQADGGGGCCTNSQFQGGEETGSESVSESGLMLPGQ